MEEEAKLDAAKEIKRIEAQAKEEADKKAKNNCPSYTKMRSIMLLKQQSLW